MPARKRRRLLSSSSDALKDPPTQPEPAEDDHEAVVGQLASLEGLSLPLRLDETVTLGRAVSNALVLRHPQVSSRHAVISSFLSSAEDTIVTLRDESLNGTTINGELIRRRTVVLLDGDVIQLGATTLVYSQSARSSLPAMRGPQAQHGDYVLLPHAPDLGRGSFAVVRLAVDLQKKRQVACKIIRRRGHDTKRIRREVDTMLSLSHPGILPLFDAFEDKTHLYLMLHLVHGGDLWQLIVQRGKLNASESKFIVYQLLKALAYMHERRISHRDLKPENVVLEAACPYPRIWLSDFGTSRLESSPSMTLCGTPSYAPPEVLVHDPAEAGYDGRLNDCWAMGLITFFCLTGYHPFDHDDDQGNIECNDEDEERNRILKLVRKGLANWSKQQWTFPDVDSHAFVSAFLQVNPLKRATAEQALCSRWMKKSEAALTKSYTYRVLGAD